MNNKADLIKKAVDRHRELILSAERYIWEHPETGYREWETHAYLKAQYERLGYTLREAGDIPGFTVEVNTGREGPCVLVLGEMDSVICPEHPCANPDTGAVHACGHNAQSAALLGIAAALKEDGILDGLCGKIRLCAVPAEELLEIEYRTQLIEKGIIKYFGGKTEFLSRGFFDGADIAFMVHTGGSFSVRRGGMIGCITKKITYKGKASHAGGAPQNGINALYAANCGLNAVNAIRETFTNSDYIRVHPIITEGGAMVNAIPAKATLESYVRGKSFNAICKVNRRVNQALIGAALSLGANINIQDFPGYAPEINSHELGDIAIEAAELVIPEYKLKVGNVVSCGSTDMGDISQIMPAIQPFSAGAKGTGHGKDFFIADAVAACVDNAKLQLAIISLLLCDNAERARGVIEAYDAPFKSKEEYLAFLGSLYESGDRIEYRDDGMAMARIDK